MSPYTRGWVLLSLNYTGTKDETVSRINHSVLNLVIYFSKFSTIFGKLHNTGSCEVKYRIGIVE